VVRRAKTVRGEVRFRMLCAPRFDYARATHTVERTPDGVCFVASGSHRLALRLRSSVPVRIESGAAVAEFTLRADESAAFVLEQAVPGTESPAAAPDYVAEAFKRTVNFWRRWIGRSSYQGRWREMVNRSALTLKLLTSRPHGSIIASPTFGLPEQVGGERNWDYRYTWLRDAAFTLYALMRLGFTEEASAFMRWVEARCEELGPGGSLQIMYAIDGRHELPEETPEPPRQDPSDQEVPGEAPAPPEDRRRDHQGHGPQRPESVQVAKQRQQPVLDGQPVRIVAVVADGVA